MDETDFESIKTSSGRWWQRISHVCQAFIDAVRDHTPSVGPIGDAVRSDALSHLSVLAIKSGGEILWDPKAYCIQTPEALNSQMQHEVRGPWAQS